MFVQLQIFPASIPPTPGPNIEYECWDAHGKYIGIHTYFEGKWEWWDFEKDEAVESTIVAYWAKIPQSLFSGA